MFETAEYCGIQQTQSKLSSEMNIKEHLKQSK